VGGGLAGRHSFHYLGARLEATLDHLHPLPPTTPIAFDELLRRAEAVLGKPLRPFLEEPDVATLERRSIVAASIDDVGPPLIHNADPGLARICYALCRALRPGIVVETGVANGVTSSLVLQALELNGSGELHSIDLPPPGTDPKLVGRLVPAELRARWTLHRGASKDVLPALARQLGPIGLFVHDSRHTHRNVARELRTVSRRLARPAAVIVDDAERHSALQDWAAAADATLVELVEQPGKPALFGVALLTGDDLQ
jgi:predicted O-methyltransferase YrrM